MMLSFDENRTYGIEIEFLADHFDRNEMVRRLSLAGIRAEVTGYNHIDRVGVWKIGTDASCGYEVVSPILRGRIGFEQLKIVCEVMNEMGAKIDKRCGLHVHHDAHDLSIKNFKNLFKFYIKHEKNIDAIMPISRRASNNTYCLSMTRGSVSTEEAMKKIDQASDISAIRNIYCTRYMKLNIQAYTSHGTIEFRQHAGTTSYEKISSWVMLTQAMVTKAKESTTSNKLSVNADGNKGIEGLLIALRLVRKDSASDELRRLVKFYRKREEELDPTRARQARENSRRNANTNERPDATLTSRIADMAIDQSRRADAARRMARPQANNIAI